MNSIANNDDNIKSNNNNNSNNSDSVLTSLLSPINEQNASSSSTSSSSSYTTFPPNNSSSNKVVTPSSTTSSLAQHSTSSSQLYDDLSQSTNNSGLSFGVDGGGGGAIVGAIGVVKRDSNELHRHLTLVDLISIGVASTVGSGIFVLCGLIAHDYAGPSTFICWGVAGLSCCASGLCYAELSGKFSVSGSTYSYVHITMGEMPAVAAGACITLEYIGAASAVARSWADKVVAFIITYYHPMIHDQEDEGGDESSLLLRILQPGYGLNPMAFCISLISVLLLLRGVKESKQVTNFFTVVKLTLIAFMSIASLSLMQRENLFPLLPSRFGLTGILRGTSSSFFGYIGFDEICCMGGEVVNPSKNLPRAVMGTIGLVTVLYVIAAIGLVGMVPYEYISVTSGFPDGFGYRGHDIIAQMTALGEIVTLPIVVLVTLMAQPRLQYAMAKDGLLPSIFAKVDATNNLWHGTLIAGTIMIIISTCVPFTYLNDLISAGVLMAFGMTAASVVLLRLKSPNDQPFLLERLLIKFNVLSLTMGLLIQLGLGDLTGQLLPVLNFLMLVALAVRIGNSCPAVPSAFGADYFEIPFVPYLPLFAQFLNWYLVGQLGPLSIMLLIGYNGFFIMLYYIFKTDKSRDCDLCSQISMASINNEEDVRF